MRRISTSSVSVNRLLALIAAAVLLLGAGEALAKKRVVVLGFAGPKAASAEAAVTSIIEKKHTTISASAYARAQKRLKLRKATDKNVSKIAADIGADAVVIGSVKRKGTRWTLRLSVREGKTGKIIDSTTIRLSGPKIDKDARADISSQLLPIIGRARGHGATSASDGNASSKKKKKKPVVEEEPEPEPEPELEETPLEETTVASADTTEDTSISARAGDDTSAAARRDTRDAADVSVGLSLMARRMSFNEDLPEDLSPNGYRGGLVPGAYVNAELYPLAFPARRTVMSGLGIAFSFDRVLFLKSQLDGMEFDTEQQRWGIGGRFRFALGGVGLKLGVGYNRLSFSIASGEVDIDLPDVAYEYVDAGAALRFPMGKRLSVILEGAYLIVLSTGEIQDMDQFGPGPANGVVADASFQLLVTPRIVARVGGRYQRMAFDFDGTGQQASMRDADMMQDVGGALDQYFGGYLTVGYLF